MKRILILLLLVCTGFGNAQNNHVGFSLGYTPVFGAIDISTYLSSPQLFEQPLRARGQFDVKTVIPGIILSLQADMVYELTLEPLVLYVGAGPNAFITPGAQDNVFAYGAHLTTGISYPLDCFSIFTEFQSGYFIAPSAGGGASSSLSLGVLIPFSPLHF